MEEKESGDAMLPQNGSVPRVEGDKLPQYLTTIAATFIVFVGGTVIGWTAPSLPYLLEPNSNLQITPHEASWIGSLLAIGALVGALPAGAIADIIGRKLFIMSLAVPFVISWAMIYFAKSVSIMYAARLIAGVALGAVCSIVPLYVTEIAEDSVRGTLGMAFSIMINIGIITSATVAAFFSYETLTKFCLVAAIASFIVSCFLVETPYFYLKKGNIDGAEKSLTKLRGPNFNARREVEYMKTHLFNSNLPKVSFKKSVRTRQSKYAIVISFGLMFFHQSSGISILSFFGGTIIRDTKVMDPEKGFFIATMVGLVAMLLGSLVINKAGRKTFLLITIGACGLCLVYLGYFFHVKSSEEPSNLLKVLSLVSICGYYLFYNVGIGPIPWITIHEVLPSDVKAVVSGWITAFNWILSFGTAKSFQPMLDTIGAAATFWVFAGVCLAGCFFISLVLIETSGKTLIEIQRELAGEKRHSKNNKNAS